VERRDLEILPHIEALKCEHPFWGYRRIWANLRFKYGIKIGKDRVYRILREHNLLVNRAEYKAKRTSGRPKPKPTMANQWWGIDMTKILTAAGWVYLVIVLDWYTKKVIGWECDYKSRSSEWLNAVDMSLRTQFPVTARGDGVHLMSDNGCQPTSVKFMGECAMVGIEQAFTSYNNPKGNADTERMMRTIKEELVWLNEYADLWQVKTALNGWIEEYNNDYLHSALGYRSPNEFEAITLLNCA
jgi:transposase InsO family protein